MCTEQSSVKTYRNYVICVNVYKYVQVEFGYWDIPSVLFKSVTNLVRGLLHHIDSHTTHHTGLYFPSSIALMTHTAECTDHTAVTNHTLT